ncbi:MAG TPA: hypothetical protein VHW60_11220 [Caulobacteraceae bacterium]|nr:hypothetical protein [Caulobacteraceae bacterium]
MTAEELRAAALRLFGERGWMSRLAEGLGVDRSTVSRWFAGVPVPGPAAAAVRAWLQLHELTGETPSASGLPYASEHQVSPRVERSRIMYIEDKSQGLNGPARIGRVYFSKTGRSLTYRGQTFRSLGGGYKANYFDVDTGDQYWISGPRKDGQDRLSPQSTQPVEIDEDVREEYWRDVRGEQKG